jgi:hypothetical protein
MSDQLDTRLKMPSGREVETDLIDSLEFRKLSSGHDTVDLHIKTTKRTVILRFENMEDAESAALDIIQLLADAAA